MREILEWLFAGGLIGLVGWQTLRIAEGFVPARAAQDTEKAAVIIQEARENIPMNAQFHPDALGVTLEESFQRWAQEQRAKEKPDENAS